MFQRTIAVAALSLCLSSSVAADELKAGSKAPDFSALGADGKKTKLSSRFGDDGKNVVLAFSRAAW